MWPAFGAEPVSFGDCDRNRAKASRLRTMECRTRNQTAIARSRSWSTRLCHGDRSLDNPAGIIGQIAVGVMANPPNALKSLMTAPSPVVHHRQVNQAPRSGVAEGPAHLLVFCSHLFGVASRRSTPNVRRHRAPCAPPGRIALASIEKHCAGDRSRLVDLSIAASISNARRVPRPVQFGLRSRILPFRNSPASGVRSLPAFVRRMAMPAAGNWRRGIGGRASPSACNKIEFGRAHLLGPLGNERRAEV